MKALTSEDLLHAWEISRSQNPAIWALNILALICPEKDQEKLASLSIGQRDALLLDLQESTFGRRLEALAPCPKCDEKNELVFDLSDIRVGTNGKTSETHEMKVSDWEVKFRLPTTLDLLSIQCADDPRMALMKRCILVSREGGKEVPAEKMDEELGRSVAEEMSRADPQADIQLAISCVSCGHRWLMIFDIVSFLQRELDFWANRILLDVHTLAEAYGWREADILSMSHLRRQLYLELVS